MRSHCLERSFYDPTLFTLRNPGDDSVQGIVDVAVDDTLWGGDSDFAAIMDELQKEIHAQ